MIDSEAYISDFINEHRHIIEKNSNPKQYNFNNALKISKEDKLNEQPPLIQKYWLGRLAFELAIRHNDVKQIKMTILNELQLIIALDEYGFTAKPEYNVLETEHTSYPAYLISEDFGKININTIFNLEKFLDVIDGAPKSKYNLDDKNYKRWKCIAKEYASDLTFLDLIKLH